MQADVSGPAAAPSVRPVAEPETFTPASAEPEPPAPRREQRSAAPAPAAAEVPSSGFVASLQLGDLDEDVLDPDATVEFKVAEFGFGEREDDTDIEEID